MSVDLLAWIGIALIAIHVIAHVLVIFAVTAPLVMLRKRLGGTFARLLGATTVTAEDVAQQSPGEAQTKKPTTAK